MSLLTSAATQLSNTFKDPEDLLVHHCEEIHWSSGVNIHLQGAQQNLHR